MSSVYLNCYECSRSCAGVFCGCLGSYIPCFMCCCYPYVNVHPANTAQVQTNQVGLKKQFGKLKEVCKPGLNYYNPCTEVIITQNIQTNVVDMPNQAVFTKDNILVTIDTVCFYRVVDPVKASFIVNDLLQSVVEITFVTLRIVCG